VLERYSSPEMRTIWTTESTYERWRQVELAVVEARVAVGQTSDGVLSTLRQQPPPSADAVAAIEEEVRHDLVAFLYAWTEGLAPDIAGHVHRDLTSSDVVDTALSLAIRAATDLVLKAGCELIVALCDCALTHRETVCVARTHGQAAAPTVFGHRIADFAFAVDRVVSRLAAASREASLANITGPVGTGAGLGSEIAGRVARTLDLQLPPAATQVLFRDNVAAWIFALVMLASVCEAIATDVRIGQHDGVDELAEARAVRQEGSSAMPHKANPVTAERICGLARVMRGYVGPALEDIALWQHRDITHSSVERVILPDASALAEHLCQSTAHLVANLRVQADVMMGNVHRAGERLASSRVLSHRLAVGVSRRDAAQGMRDEGWPPSSTIESVQTPTVAATIDEMKASTTLADCFDGVERLRRQYRSSFPS
jgi:adenylosuccinate lyase